jgi:F0F1-type ATP synthase assembly protein I
MIKYDPTIIQNFAEKMYKKASSIIAASALVGIIVGAGLGIFIDESIGAGAIVPIIGAIVGGIIGFAIGQERAFVLKLQAQTALCQMQIEQNIRGKKD